MATLAQIAEQVTFILSGGDASRDSELDPREIQLLIVQELNALMKIEYWNNIKLDEDHGITGQYIVTSTVSVAYDNVRLEAYVIVPSTYISLGALDRGIQEIRPLAANASAFIPLANGMHSLSRGTKMNCLEGQIGYYPEGNKAYFTKNPKTEGMNNVLVKLIVSTLTNFISDPAIESELVKRVVAILMAQKPQDKINNNNPNM
jgi:hypothetical protein